MIEVCEFFSYIGHEIRYVYLVKYIQVFAQQIFTFTYKRRKKFGYDLEMCVLLIVFEDSVFSCIGYQ